MPQVHSIETLGTHDGPGLRLVVFLQGCNYRCLYCQNVDTQDIKKGGIITQKDIIHLATRQMPYFGEAGGVTFSGGEPLLQAKRLIGLFKKLKRKSINLVLDTNGSVFNSHVRKLIKFTDLVLLDIKQIDSDRHKQITGHVNKLPLRFAEYLESMGKPFWLRYVLVPDFTNQAEDLHRLGQHFKDYKYLQKVEILPYHKFGSHKHKEIGREYLLEFVDEPTKKQCKEAKDILSQYLKKVIVAE